MRWVLVARHVHPSRSGIGAAHALMLRAAARAGWEVELVTDAPAPVPAGVRVTIVRAAREPAGLERLVPELRRLETIRPYRYERWALAAARELARRRRSVDGVEFPDAEGSAWIAQRSVAVRAQLGGAPIVVHAHTPMFLEDAINGVPEDRFGRARTHARERAALQAAVGVLATSRLLARRLERDPGVGAVVAPYPLEPLVPLVPLEPRATPAHCDETERVLFVGSLQPRKGIDLLLEAVQPVLARRPRLRVDCVGPDTTATPDGRSVQATLESRLDARLAPRIRFLGACAHARVRAMMAQAHLIVVPSRFDAFSLAAAEAVLLERPLLLTERCGITEVLPRLEPVPHDDAAALRQAIEQALDEPASRRDRAQLRVELLQACTAEQALSARRALVERAARASLAPCSGSSGGSHDAIAVAARELAERLRQARPGARMPLGSGA